MTLNIIGGTYDEICIEPIWNELYGSGLRAAHALSDNGHKIIFHTMVGSMDYDNLMYIGRSMKIEIKALKIPETTFFEYRHPLANPFFTEPNGIQEKLSAKGDFVLQFGMVEGNATVTAKKVVYDPQSPVNPQSFWNNGSITDELVWVTNLQEAIAFTKTDNFEDIKAYLFNHEKIEAAVIKKGSEGATLIQKNKSDFNIPAFKTKSVWPIGTGDIFSSSFAYNYLIKGLSLEESAYLASLSTAYYAETCVLPLPQKIDASKFIEFNSSGAAKKSVYLAGPFFTISQRWFIQEIRDQLLKFGLNVFSPFHDVGLGNAEIVVPLDIDAIKKADIIVAILDGLDPGTLFEIGYAKALGIPVIAFNELVNNESLTMLIGTGCIIENDFSTMIYKTFWEANNE